MNQDSGFSSQPRKVENLTEWLAEAWLRPAIDRSVEVEGARVSYRDWHVPTGQRGSREGLVFVHGFIAHARWWDHICPSFTDQYQVIAPDFTGMGDSARRDVYCRKQYARETIAAIRDAGLEKATIVAHSFGALSSLYASTLEPELISRVILVDSNIFREEADGYAVNAGKERTYASLAMGIERYRLIPPGKWPVRQILEYIAQHSLKKVDGGWRWKFDPKTFEILASENLRLQLHGAKTPVEFIRAESSDIVTASALDRIVMNLPNLDKIITVPRSGHHVMIEQPLGFVAALSALLANPRTK